MNGQSQAESMIEAALNIGSGFIISWMVWTFVVAPLFGLPFGMHDSLAITAIFTVTSLLRAYAWRRWFNWRFICKLRSRS